MWYCLVPVAHQNGGTYMEYLKASLHFQCFLTLGEVIKNFYLNDLLYFLMSPVLGISLGISKCPSSNKIGLLKDNS